MGREIRCTRCGETFLAMGGAAVVPCAACGEPVRADAAPAAALATPAGKGAPAPAARSAPAAGARPGAAIQRVCPSCGERFPTNVKDCPHCGTNYRGAKAEQAQVRADEDSGFAAEKAGIRKGVLGGVLMIVIAAVWFFGGMAAGYVFFYPPILAVIGIYSVVKGLADGNVAGKKAPVRATPPRRPR